MATKKTTGGAGNFQDMVSQVREEARTSVQTLLEKNPDKLAPALSTAIRYY